MSATRPDAPSAALQDSAGALLPPRWRRALAANGGLVALATLSGGLMGYSFPGHALPGLWLLVFTPLFMALDLLRARGRLRERRRWLLGAALCWWFGVVLTAITGGWVVNTAHVFGYMPLPVAWLVNLLGYGTLMGIDTLLIVGLPFLLGRRRGPWGVALLLLWVVVVPPLLPKFLYWTHGELLVHAPPLHQAADLIGSAGLNLPVFALYLLLYGLARGLYAADALPLRRLLPAGAAVLALFLALWAYGSWRVRGIERAAAAPDAPSVRLVGIQPNFSLKELASNPELSPGERQQSIDALLGDSRAALARKPPRPGETTVLVWPESTFPGVYVARPELRRQVESWVAAQDVQLVLTALDARRNPDSFQGYDLYGATLHLDRRGRPVGLYHKLALIPFGETVPLGDWLPWFRDALHRQIPQMGEFTPGSEYTVFPVGGGVTLAPMICFDTADYRVARGMTANGANVGLVLANMAWFGRTTVSQQFEHMVRFRAIENRIPILLLSQNGTSVLFDAAGRPASPRLGQFEQGVLDVRVSAGAADAFYTRHGVWVNAALRLALALLLVRMAWQWRRGGAGRGA